MMRLIFTIFEDYSKRHLTKKTDRVVAISGLHTSIANSLDCPGRYGVFEPFLHQNLLWQALDSEMQRIDYPTEEVPSWSWMAYTGAVQFIKTRFYFVKWTNNVQFDNERTLALIVNVNKFQNCTIEPETTRSVILDLSGERRGWVQYDISGTIYLREMRCICIGGFRKPLFSPYKYYIIVVRPTRVNGEYERVGLGIIERKYVGEEAINMRLV